MYYVVGLFKSPPEYHGLVDNNACSQVISWFLLLNGANWLEYNKFLYFTIRQKILKVIKLCVKFRETGS